MGVVDWARGGGLYEKREGGSIIDLWLGVILNLFCGMWFF